MNVSHQEYDIIITCLQQFAYDATIATQNWRTLEHTVLIKVAVKWAGFLYNWA